MFQVAIVLVSYFLLIVYIT